VKDQKTNNKKNTSLGKTLMIANPVAQSSYGSSTALFIADVLREELFPHKFSVIMTEGKSHGRELAKNAKEFDTVVVVGDDGLVHDVVNGLMSIDPAQRPALGMIPVGIGVDYARTLHMSFSTEKAVKQLLNAEAKYFDVGICNNEYFVQTLSFGFDAAVGIAAIGQDNNTSLKSNNHFPRNLFLRTGLMSIKKYGKVYSYEAFFAESGEKSQGEMFLFAIQLGKTYGGGFIICPDTQVDDGLFTLCIGHAPVKVPRLIYIFLLARYGFHTKVKQVEIRKESQIKLSFDADDLVPAQIDGKAFPAKSYDVRCIKQALTVLVPLQF
jgi:YegS/Rv2252/BmrU family lipid kinase